MNIGALEFQMTADMAQLKRDMDECKRSVTDTMNSIDNVVGIAKNAFVGFLGVASVGAFAGMIKGSIEATGGLKDLATQTGASAAALGEFRKMGAYTDTSIESITGSMGKLSKNMVAGTEDTKGAGVAIKAMGLDFDTIKAMKPEDQMLAIATGMNKFADGADKSAAAQALFGKEGAKLLPFLKDLGDGAEAITTKLTDQEVALRKTQAAMADAFGDNLTQIRKESDGWKKDLATGMTPALYEASQAFLDVSKSTGGLKGEISTLSKDGTITEWTRGAITVLTYLMDGFSGVGTVVKSVGLTIGAWAAGVGSAVSTAMTVVKQAAEGDFTGAMATMKGGMEQQKTIASELATSLDATWGAQTLGSKLRDRMADIKATGMASEESKPQMNVTAVLAANEAAHKASTAAQKEAEKQAKALAAEIKKQEENYLKLNSSITEKTAAMLAELEQSKPLTKAQEAEVKLLADLASGTVKMTAEQKAHTLATIANYGEVEKQVTEYKKQEAEIKANTAANVAFSEKLTKATDDTNAQTEKVLDNTAKLGLNAEQLAALVIQKGYDEAATYDQKAAWAEQNMLGADLVQQYKDQATALRALADAKQQGIHVRAAVDAQIAWQKTTDSIANGLGSALATAIGQGKDLWLTFRDYMVRVILDGAIKNALSSVLGEGINWLMSSIAGIKIGGGTGGSLLSTGLSTIGSAVTGGISSIGSGITSALGLGGATTAAAGGTAATATAVTGGGSIVATDLGLLGTGSTATTATTGATAAGTSTLASLAGPAFFAALAFKLFSGGGPETKYGASYAATGDGMVNKLYGNNTGGEFPGGVMPTAISDTVAYINAQLEAGGSPLRVASFSGGGESDIVKAEGYSYAGGTLTDGSTFGMPTQAGDNLGIADNAGVLSAFQADLAAAAAQAIELGLTGSTKTPLAEHTFVPYKGIYDDFEGFATGGDFRGGWRIVGERGPELEATGPSRIFDAATTASMLRSGGASNDEVVTELRAMRQQLAQIHQESRRTADATNGLGESPMVIEVDA